MFRSLLLVAVVVLGVFVQPQLTSAPVLEAKSFPSLIQLPNGWLPEGVVTGKGPVIYSGSRRHGAIYAADLRTGEGSVVIPPQEGRMATGLDFDNRSDYLFVAGGTFGTGYIYDVETGGSVRSYQFVQGGATFVNDVIVTREAAYFTDSMRPVLYRVALGPGGDVASSFTEIQLSGDYVHQTGFNANGIVATPSEDRLIIVQSNTGRLFQVDPQTGVASVIDLGGYSVSAGDGMLLQGHTLFVVRNAGLIAEIQLSATLTSGRLVREITNANFDTPTTVARFGNALYVVNARFSAGSDPALPYWIVRIER